MCEPKRDDALLDLAFSSGRALHDSVQVTEPFATSDHCQIALSLRMLPKSEIRPRCGYKAFNGRHDLIESYLISINWDYEFAPCKNLDDKVAYLNNLLTGLLICLSLVIVAAVPFGFAVGSEFYIAGLGLVVHISLVTLLIVFFTRRQLSLTRSRYDHFLSQLSNV